MPCHGFCEEGCWEGANCCGPCMQEVGLLKDDDEEMLFTSPLRLLQVVK